MQSLFTSVKRNGVFKTLYFLKSMLAIKFNLSESINIAKNEKVYLRNRTSDIPVFRQIFLDHEYSFPIPFEPKVILDCGANIGLFTKYMKLKFPNAKYICVEPEPNNFDQLYKNNGGEENVILLQKAIWNNKKGVYMEIDPEHGEWGAMAREMNGSPQKRLVESLRMEDIFDDLELNIIDIVKFDVEGAEKYIFADNTEWLKRVKILIIELHDFMEQESSNNFFKAIGEFAPFNFRMSGENMVFIRTDL